MTSAVRFVNVDLRLASAPLPATNVNPVPGSGTSVWLRFHAENKTMYHAHCMYDL